jgi:hypothetical protein
LFILEIKLANASPRKNRLSPSILSLTASVYSSFALVYFSCAITTYFCDKLGITSDIKRNATDTNAIDQCNMKIEIKALITRANI